MIRKEKFLEIPEREIPVNIIQYEKEDIFLLQKLFSDWMNLNEKIKKIGGRPSILPPEFVEALVAYKMGYWKIDDMRLGFDCFDPNAPEGSNRIEIKYATGRTDFSSFSSVIKWDRLIFVKFYNESPKDCYFEVYDIDIQMILEESEHFGRYMYDRRGVRPRISVIKELIERGIYREKREFSLF
ncbi:MULTISPECIES: Bsp6I family type II restriction endonuclease [unclassified Eubacterium (in: firmicutes)]|jgi:hypothetical protein|uniref:Bsp6I family type II restriction endonuclease n=1 Tax=unclassified Eubacterium (in: firmicutes) TaxID=2624479 RepID=UPI000E509D5C|nr:MULTISPECIES: Bsp6I family type II restriction endonuclease [unclassified Eubacterium (in: firmicutes)]RHR33928.1 Bsp6I family restriction endonuclease [Eubacterium sp. AF19-12LB]